MKFPTLFTLFHNVGHTDSRSEVLPRARKGQTVKLMGQNDEKSSATWYRAMLNFAWLRKGIFRIHATIAWTNVRNSCLV